MALGKILKNAREAMGLSPSDVAEQTNMMVQIVEELENENFHRIAAPIYGRGFLKLYAELLKIDPQPLIDEFMDICSGKIVPELRKRESLPAQEKPPVQQIAPAERVAPEPEAIIPQRVAVTPHQSMPNLDGIPRPLRKAESQPMTPTITVEENKPRAVPDVNPEIEPAPAPADEAEPAVEEQAVPKPGSALFDSDEPNLFNTTPLQERIAEARRLMEEEEQSAEPEAEKKSPLHFGSNTALPIFQIGGRMDETYATTPRQTRPRPQAPRQRSPRWDGITRFFALVRAYLPFEVNQKSVFVYGSLGLIVLIFMIVGITALFKLTGSRESVEVKPVAVAEKKVEKQPPQKKAVTERQVPPPPDMYFD